MAINLSEAHISEYKITKRKKEEKEKKSQKDQHKKKN